MITVSNIKRYTDLPFNDYLNYPGYSFSFLKREKAGVAEPIPTTQKMELGKMVDAILCDDVIDYENKDYPAAKSIASALVKDFGDIISLSAKQVSYVCDFEYAGLTMPFRGRLDFELPGPDGNIVIDLKVCHQKNVDGVISWMRYPDQLFGYSRPSGASKGFLLIYCIPLKQTILKYFDLNTDSNAFFEEKILRFGTAKG